MSANVRDNFIGQTKSAIEKMGKKGKAGKKTKALLGLHLEIWSSTEGWPDDPEGAVVVDEVSEHPTVRAIPHEVDILRHKQAARNRTAHHPKSVTGQNHISILNESHFRYGSN